MVNFKRSGHVRHCPWQLLSFPFPFFHLVKDSAKFMLFMKKGHGRALKILQLGFWFKSSTLTRIVQTHFMLIALNFLLIMLKFLLSNISCLKYHLSKIFHLEGKILSFKVYPLYIGQRTKLVSMKLTFHHFFFMDPLQSCQI